eukprot:TRINITY_DN7550_c0_g1_i1.p1 TRINITY_DN7550_c0_g1~~TRINITY_DN7550_c0_g1_i1.p1  ORF type:complete len:162 (-),score=39.02 TRINITY_DN7550_c0_g1_i1:122-607(-)
MANKRKTANDFVYVVSKSECTPSRQDGSYWSKDESPASHTETKNLYAFQDAELAYETAMKLTYGCDGYWEGYEDDTIVDIVRDCMKDGRWSTRWEAFIDRYWEIHEEGFDERHYEDEDVPHVLYDVSVVKLLSSVPATVKEVELPELTDDEDEEDDGSSED